MASYTEVLKDTIAHAPMEPSKAKREKLVLATTKNESIELELVAVVANMGKHAAFYPTKAVDGEQLPAGFVKSFSGFLVDTNVCKVKINQIVVKSNSIHLQKHAIMAYFVGGETTITCCFTMAYHIAN
jgi:hypothetical protein